MVFHSVFSWQIMRDFLDASIFRDCGKAKFSEPIKWQDSNTPTTTPYKAFSGVLLLWGRNVRGAVGSDKSKHLEYTAYFWKGNINNIADFSWVITLSHTRSLFLPNWRPVLNHVSVQIHGVFRSKQLSNFQTSFKGVFTQINSCLFQ